MYANLKPDDNVVIVSTGGLGLMAIRLVKAVTGANIIALDLDDAKLKVAKKNGADIIINSKEGDPVKAVMELTDKLGADAIIDFVVQKILFSRFKKTSTGLVAVNDSVPTYTELSLVRHDKGRSLSISCGDHKHKRVD